MYTSMLLYVRKETPNSWPQYVSFATCLTEYLRIKNFIYVLFQMFNLFFEIRCIVQFVYVYKHMTVRA